MRNKIIEYKMKLENLKETHPNVDKSIVSKLLVMANLAEMSILSETKLSEYELTTYFEGQAFVGRYFCDFGLDWVATEYYDITQYIREFTKSI